MRCIGTIYIYTHAHAHTCIHICTPNISTVPCMFTEIDNHALDGAYLQ